MACYRKVHDDWKVDSILTECVPRILKLLPNSLANKCRYRKFAGSKWRTLDEAFISGFEPEEVMAIVEATEGIPIPTTKRPSLPMPPFPTPPASDGYEWEEY